MTGGVGGASLTDYWCSHRAARGWPVESPSMHACAAGGGGSKRLTYKCSLVADRRVGVGQSDSEAADGQQMNGWKFDGRETRCVSIWWLA